MVLEREGHWHEPEIKLTRPVRPGVGKEALIHGSAKVHSEGGNNEVPDCRCSFHRSRGAFRNAADGISGPDFPHRYRWRDPGIAAPSERGQLRLPPPGAGDVRASNGHMD